MTRIVIMTGSSIGIGRAIAEAFNKKGDTVIATARARNPLRP